MSSQKINHGSLKGFKVLDLTRVLAGPWASQLLGDYGAAVIKVERPGSGDDTRHWGPPWLHEGDEHQSGDSAYFLSANRNKRSLAVDLGHEEGASIVRELAMKSDILLENFKVGTMERFGLEIRDLQAANPSLIVCSISAYGQSGSRAGQPGYDAMIQASGGLMSITGEAEGDPQKVGVAIADIMTGMYAVTAILAAVVARNTSGQGQHIDIPLYDSQVAWLANQNMNYLVGAVVPQRMGSAHPNLVPYQSFPTRDGHLMLAIGNDRQFRRLAACLESDGLADDPRFATNADRVEHRNELVKILADAFAGRDSEDWLARLANSGIPAGPINSIPEVFSEDYAVERELVRTLPHALAGEIPTVANPVRFSATPVEYRNAPPLLGEHTVEILATELAMARDEINRLVAAGVLEVAKR